MKHFADFAILSRGPQSPQASPMLLSSQRPSPHGLQLSTVVAGVCVELKVKSNSAHTSRKSSAKLVVLSCQYLLSSSTELETKAVATNDHTIAHLSAFTQAP